MALKGKYNQETIDKIVTAVDSELGDSWNYGSDDLSDLRREYIDRFWRLDYGNEEPGFSNYHSGLIQRTVLQQRAYLKRQYNKSMKPIVKFRDLMSTTYLHHILNNKEIIDGRRLVSDAAWNGLLLKTWAVKVYVKEERKVEENTEIFRGTDKAEVDAEVEAFLAEDEEIEVIETIEEEVEIEGELQRLVPRVEQPSPASQAPIAPQPPIPGAPAAQPQIGLEPVAEPEEIELKEYIVSVRYKRTRDIRKPQADIIPPYEWHISRQSPDINSAGVKGRVHPFSLTELRKNYGENVKKIYKLKSKKDEDAFWEDVNGEWLGWTQQNEWYEMWVKDNSSYYEGYYFDVTADDNSKAHGYLVADVELQIDIDDSGYAKRYNIVKVGDKLLSCEEVTVPLFHAGAPIEISGRWLGMGTPDLIYDEDLAETRNMRALDDGVLQNSYSNPVVDEEQIRLEDVINRAPDTVIRRKVNSAPKPNVPAIEQYQTNPPAGTGLQILEVYKENAGTATGAGKFFQGHNQDDVSKRRISTEQAQIIENNSDLMLDDIANEFWHWFKEVGIMLHNAAIAGKASPIETYDADGKPITIDPLKDLSITNEAALDINVGSSDEQDAIDRSTKIVEAITLLEQSPTLANVVTEEGKTLAVARLFKDLGVEDPSGYLREAAPVDPMQNPQVQQLIQQVQQQADERVKQEVEMHKKNFDNQIKWYNAQTQRISVKGTQDLKKQDLAAGHAYKFELSDQAQSKIDQDNEQFAATQGLAEERFELDKESADREYGLAKRDIKANIN